MEIIKNLWNLKRPYVTEEAGQNLFKYKYAGSDASLLYIYFWSPMAAKIAERLPNWLA